VRPRQARYQAALRPDISKCPIVSQFMSFFLRLAVQLCHNSAKIQSSTQQKANNHASKSFKDNNSSDAMELMEAAALLPKQAR
jgi:hypothetical protein